MTYAPLANYMSVAEHTIMLILLCVKNYNIINNRFRTSNPDYNARNTHCGVELEGKTLGIFRYGKIGREVAKKASHGFGMKVICYDPYIEKSAASDIVAIAETKEEVLQNSDFGSLHMPSLESTKGFFGSREFIQMKKTAYFINAARGELVIEDELIDALEKKLIAGAALDVYEIEPPLGSNPLFKMENVIVTFHYAGLTKESSDRIGIHAAMGIDEVLTFTQPSWPLNNPSGRNNLRMKKLS